MEDNPPRLAKQVPLVIELKPSTIMSAPTLGLPDLAKPFTLCDRKGQRWLWECCPRLWGHGTDPGLISNQLGNVATGRLGRLRAVAAVA